jgi:hypothetical protein
MLKQHPFFVRPKRQKKESPTLSAGLSYFYILICSLLEPTCRDVTAA